MIDRKNNIIPIAPAIFNYDDMDWKGIDEFKIINDTMGHAAGDILLKELSVRFQKCVRGSDTVSRVGGDEFTILMLKITCLKDTTTVVERIIESKIIFCQ